MSKGPGAGERNAQPQKKACCKMQVLLHAKGTAVGAGLALPGRENESLSEKVGRIRIFVRIRPTFCRVSV